VRASPRIAALLLVGALTSVVSAQQTNTPSLDALLGKAAWYAFDFIDEFSHIVAEERYVQDSNVALAAFPLRMAGRGNQGATTQMGRSRHRELKSDFLLVKTRQAEFWQPFRDVFEVDHVPIRDREERLTKLFINPSADNLDKAREIQDESTRYNLGAVQRTINNPVFPLMLLQAEYQTHFHYTLEKQDKRVGEDVWIVAYREIERPSLIRGRPGEDMLAEGRFWIDAASGHVLKAELVVKHPDVKANLTTVFRADSRFAIDLPVEMHEDYDTASNRVTGTATYGRFRRFQVSAEHDITAPQ